MTYVGKPSETQDMPQAYGLLNNLIQITINEHPRALSLRGIQVTPVLSVCND